jgi:hypothetical protein
MDNRACTMFKVMYAIQQGMLVLIASCTGLAA